MIRQLLDLFSVIGRLLRQFGGNGRLLAAVLVSSAGVMLFEGVGVGLFVPLLSLLLGGENATPMRPLQWLQTEFPARAPAFYVTLLCLAIVAAITAKNLSVYAAQVLAAALKRRVVARLRDALFQRLHRADLDLFDRRPSGDLANVFLVETFRTTSALDTLLALVQRGSIAAFYVLALFYISLPLTAIVVVLSMALGGTISFVYRRLTRAGIELTDLNHKIATALTQSFAGIRIVRATNSQEREARRFHDLNLAQARAEEASMRAASLLSPLAETLAVIGGMVVIGTAYVFLVSPGLMLSSYLLGYGFIMLRLLPLLNHLYSLQGHLLYLGSGIREVQTWLETPTFPERPFGDVPFTTFHREVAFERVSYTYPNGSPALVDVDFVVPIDRTIAIVGQSGSGKSTVTALLLRFRAPTSGRITIDGRDYWDFSPESWHRATALVEQDAFLFHGTLRENILYGATGATDAALRRAVEIANLQDVVAALPHGLDTLVGERGAMLSGGQRQRVALARAVVRDPRILILDEATSHLDSVSEQLVQQALVNASRGRTTIVIAHRLQTVRDADRVIVLDRGRVVEQGTWESLETSGGTFQKLLSGLA